MANLTAEELHALEDTMNCEQNLIKKFHNYASIAQDTQIQKACQQSAKQHRKHFDALMSYLG
ncbi:MAG: spore coat protein [Oscillospiraceae bacterium]|nr:spore coat protein [Oscillospiraceae bacterium]